MRRNKNRGIILLTTLAVLVILGIFLIAAVWKTQNGILTTKNVSQEIKAYWAAKAGFTVAANGVVDNVRWPFVPGSENGGGFKMTREGDVVKGYDDKVGSGFSIYVRSRLAGSEPSAAKSSLGEVPYQSMKDRKSSDSISAGEAYFLSIGNCGPSLCGLEMVYGVSQGVESLSTASAIYAGNSIDINVIDKFYVQQTNGTRPSIIAKNGGVSVRGGGGSPGKTSSGPIEIGDGAVFSSTPMTLNDVDNIVPGYNSRNLLKYGLNLFPSTGVEQPSVDVPKPSLDMLKIPAGTYCYLEMPMNYTKQEFSDVVDEVISIYSPKYFARYYAERRTIDGNTYGPGARVTEEPIVDCVEDFSAQSLFNSKISEVDYSEAISYLKDVLPDNNESSFTNPPAGGEMQGGNPLQKNDDSGQKPNSDEQKWGGDGSSDNPQTGGTDEVPNDDPETDTTAGDPKKKDNGPFAEYLNNQDSKVDNPNVGGDGSTSKPPTGNGSNNSNNRRGGGGGGAQKDQAQNETDDRMMNDNYILMNEPDDGFTRCSYVASINPNAVAGPAGTVRRPLVNLEHDIPRADDTGDGNGEQGNNGGGNNGGGASYNVEELRTQYKAFMSKKVNSAISSYRATSELGNKRFEPFFIPAGLVGTSAANKDLSIPFSTFTKARILGNLKESLDAAEKRLDSRPDSSGTITLFGIRIPNIFKSIVNGIKKLVDIVEIANIKASIAEMIGPYKGAGVYVTEKIYYDKESGEGAYFTVFKPAIDIDYSYSQLFPQKLLDAMKFDATDQELVFSLKSSVRAIPSHGSMGEYFNFATYERGFSRYIIAENRRGVLDLGKASAGAKEKMIYASSINIRGLVVGSGQLVAYSGDVDLEAGSGLSSGEENWVAIYGNNVRLSKISADKGEIRSSSAMARNEGAYAADSSAEVIKMMVEKNLGIKINFNGTDSEIAAWRAKLSAVLGDFGRLVQIYLQKDENGKYYADMLQGIDTTLAMSVAKDEEGNYIYDTNSESVKSSNAFLRFVTQLRCWATGEEYAVVSNFRGMIYCKNNFEIDGGTSCPDFSLEGTVIAGNTVSAKNLNSIVVKYNPELSKIVYSQNAEWNSSETLLDRMLSEGKSSGVRNEGYFKAFNRI